MEALAQHVADRKARERLLSKAADKDAKWLLDQIAKHPLTVACDDAVRDGRPEVLKAFASRMVTVAGAADAKADLTGQRVWRAYAAKFSEAGPDLVAVALRARRDVIEFLIRFPAAREKFRR